MRTTGEETAIGAPKAPRFCAQIVAAGEERALGSCASTGRVGSRLDAASGVEMPAKIGAPGFEPGTSPTRTARATRLRHAPKFDQSRWLVPATALK